jgi:hypothetical protein
LYGTIKISGEFGGVLADNPFQCLYGAISVYGEAIVVTQEVEFQYPYGTIKEFCALLEGYYFTYSFQCQYGSIKSRR